MRVDEQDWLRLVEKAHSLAFVDIEATGLRGDYNSVLCVSVKPHGLKPETFLVKQPGNDQGVVVAAKEALEACAGWVTYYGKGFDIPMLNTRLLRWHRDPIEKRPHIDLYYALKYNLLMARRSQSHLLSWLGTPEQKMTIGAEEWNEVLRNPSAGLKTMKARCESDVVGLEALYERTKHLIHEIKR